MPADTNISYGAIKQRRYRERVKAKEAERAFNNILPRAALIFTRALFDNNNNPVEAARAAFSGDRALELLVRSASGPAMTTQTGWAKELAQVTTTFLAALVGPSAGADLLSQGLQVHFSGSGSISFPTITPGHANFVGQGQPIPVVQFATSAGVKLEPHKLALITVLTREMVESSTAEEAIRAALIESAAVGLDSALFSASAGTADIPPGLLNGISSLTPSTATPLTDAMVADLAALGGAVARVAGSDIVFVTAPEQALAINLRSPNFAYPVLASKALAPKTVIAVAANAIASGFDPTPTIEASRQPELHMDTVPAEIVSGAGGVAYPVGSIFQTDKVALKMKMNAAWALRSPAALAWMQNVSW